MNKNLKHIQLKTNTAKLFAVRAICPSTMWAVRVAHRADMAAVAGGGVA